MNEEGRCGNNEGSGAKQNEQDQNQCMDHNVSSSLNQSRKVYQQSDTNGRESHSSLLKKKEKTLASREISGPFSLQYFVKFF